MTNQRTNEMLRLTIENGGGTFEQSGKLFAPKLGSEPVGYAVGLRFGTLEIVPLDDLEAFDLAIDRAFRYSDHVGTWVHDGEIHIDPVIYCMSLEYATERAKKNNQLAIYSFAEKKEIYV